MNIKEKSFHKNKRRLLLFSTVVFILSIPLIAMKFTNQVNWTVSDFLIMGMLLSVTALGIELVIRNVKTMKARVLLCAIVLLIFFIIWAELAVGIFGTPFSGS